MTGSKALENSSSNQLRKVDFIIGSGASDHIVNEIDIFTAEKSLEKPLKISIAKKGEAIVAEKIGSIKITTNLGVTGTLEKVLYAPEVPYNLLSVRRIQEAGMSIIFDKTGGVKIERNGKAVLTGKLKGNIICVTFTVERNMYDKTYANNITVLNAYKMWHERLGHIGHSKFVKMKQNYLVQDTELISKINPTKDLCEACICIR